MEDRRTFLKRSIPRLLVLASVFSLRPVREGSGGTLGIDLVEPRYVALLKDLVDHYQFSEKDLRSLFGKVVLHPEIIDRFERPAEALPYFEYRRRFVQNNLIEMSRDYLRKNIDVFQSVEKSFGVEKEIICSILGIESKFGQAGIQSFRVFDVLNTAFSTYPRRESFYRAELVEFLLLCREERMDPLSVNGSYAGAFGVPQFMPSSFRRYAVDFDRDGKKDLIHSTADIVASVANYLRAFHWRHEGLLWRRAVLDRDNPEVKQLVGSGLRTSTPVSRLLGIGVRIDPLPEQTEEVSLLIFELKQGEESLLAVFENFRAITHYNRSVNYALAVAELAGLLPGGTVQ